MHDSRAKNSQILYVRQFFPPPIAPIVCHHSMNASNSCNYFN